MAKAKVISMKPKLKEYLDAVFADAERRAPDNEKLRELKEEMLCNLYDRYDDLLAAGKTPSAAYNVAVAGVGDISALLDSVVGSGNADGASAARTEKPRGAQPEGKRPLTDQEQEALQKYRKRSAVLTSISVAMYILCWVPLVILGGLLDEVGGIVGLAVMFLMIAGATGMNIYNSMTKPSFAADDDGDDDDDDDRDRDDGDGAVTARRSPVYKAISGALWALTFVVYFGVSFGTGAWHITWLIFLMATALDNVIKAIFDLRR